MRLLAAVAAACACTLAGAVTAASAEGAAATPAAATPAAATPASAAATAAAAAKFVDFVDFDNDDYLQTSRSDVEEDEEQEEDAQDVPYEITAESSEYHELFIKAAGWASENFWWTMPLLMGLLCINLIITAHLLGAAQPERHVVVRAVKVSKSTAAVWKLITDQEKYPEWRSSVKSATNVELPGTKEKGVVETTSWGKTYLRVTENERPKLWVREIVVPAELNKAWYLGGQWFSGSITFEIEQLGDDKERCAIFVTKQGYVRPPAIRFLWSLWGFDSDVLSLLWDACMALGEDKSKINIVGPVDGKLPF
ncbi:hypothetical protein HK105_205989 [Polyrhizophydium stewartii]|uniref:Uncharacterized protein n=1 Tax=Polyrhizophydium stewartii TaxID=2732419 RepID=A0ABR4N4F1_9FUNG